MAPVIARLEAALTPALARKAALALMLASLAALALWIATAPDGVRPDGSPVGSDFILFHAAGRLALHGGLARAYDTEAIRAVERALAPGMSLTYLWRYPPPLALLLAPLGDLPYLAAYAAWTLAGLAAFATGLRRLLAGRDGLLLALGAPATFVCLMHGQTAFLTGAALAWGLALSPRRPLLAGAILSLLVCKPHFAVLVPLLLLAGGRWRILAGFVLGASVLCGAALLAFGLDPWLAFLRSGSAMGDFLARGGVSWAKVPSVFVLAMSLHAPQPLAWVAQTAVSVGVVVTTALIWRGRGPDGLKGAALVIAVLTVSPYVIDYDLTLVSIAAALIIVSGAAARPGMRLALFGALATPVVAPAIAQLTTVQLGALPLLALGALVARAYWSEAREAAGSATGSPAPVRFTARVVG